MHDGAPVHFSLTAREDLPREYANHWIGRNAVESNQPWPPTSSEVNSLDFFSGETSKH